MPKLKEYKMYINGKWVDAENKKTFESLNPENNEPWAVVPEADAKDVDKAVQSAQKAHFQQLEDCDFRIQLLLLENNNLYLKKHVFFLHILIYHPVQR